VLLSLGNTSESALLGADFHSPANMQVVSACMILTAPAGKIPKDVSWNAGKKSMGNVDAFLKSLINFDKDNVPAKNVETCEKVSPPSLRLMFVLPV
jgi:dynein heavy chain, axonemal